MLKCFMSVKPDPTKKKKKNSDALYYFGNIFAIQSIEHIFIHIKHYYKQD